MRRLTSNPLEGLHCFQANLFSILLFLKSTFILLFSLSASAVRVLHAALGVALGLLSDQPVTVSAVQHNDQQGALFCTGDLTCTMPSFPNTDCLQSVYSFSLVLVMQNAGLIENIVFLGQVSV